MASLSVYTRRNQDFTGRYPQLSCNEDGWVVMVFNSAWFDGPKMYSIAGLIERDNVKWAQQPQYISDGHYPKVAINDSKVVIEVHKSQWGNTLWYSIGVIDEQTKEIKWSEKDHTLGSGGCNPAVAFTNLGTVVVVYEQSNKTFYRIGEVNKAITDITWHASGAEEVFTIPTKEPSISMNEKGLVVVAANASGIMTNKIVFHIGTLEENHSITWKDFDLALSKDMWGCCPVVAINKQNHIISVHMSNSFRKLYVVYGVVNVNKKRIEWSEQGKPLEYDTGSYPAVTLNSKGQVVRMREVNASFGMYYEVGNLSIS